jgi:hypothetical protein
VRFLKLPLAEFDDGVKELKDRTLLLDQAKLGVVEHDALAPQVQVEQGRQRLVGLGRDQRRGGWDARHRISLGRV